MAIVQYAYSIKLFHDSEVSMTVADDPVPGHLLKSWWLWPVMNSYAALLWRFCMHRTVTQVDENNVILSKKDLIPAL